MNGKTSRSFYEGIMLVPSENFKIAYPFYFANKKSGAPPRPKGFCLNPPGVSRHLLPGNFSCLLPILTPKQLAVSDI